MLLRKFMVYGLWFIVLMLFAAVPVSAQTTDPSTSLRMGLPSNVSPTSPLYTDLLIHNMFHSFSCLAIGQSVIGQPCLTYQMTKNAQGMLQGVPVLSQTNFSGGALGATTSLIGALYQNPPVRTADYLASISGNFGVIREANAQVVGSGAQVLSPILKLWQVSRNISYVIMIIIFLIIGLMIMFRNKLNPQTVITAQAALPGLVIGLILITFSYFLAGLISDMAFVGTNVVGYYFAAAQDKLGDPTRLNLTQKISNSNSSILDILAPLTGIATSSDIADLSGIIFEKLGDAQGAVKWLAFFLSTQFLSPMIPSELSTNPVTAALMSFLKPVIAAAAGGTATMFISPLLGQLLSFAAALALVYMMLKLLFKLIMAWLTIIFLTITAPFQFLFASLPGRQGMATGWILNMLGNILVFPAVIAVIYFVAVLLGDKYIERCSKNVPNSCLTEVSSSNPINNSSFVPPVYATGEINIIGKDTFPLFGGIDLRFVKILLAFGALMALPTIPDIIIRSVGRAGQAGQMIGQEIMGGARFGQGYAQKGYMGGVGWGQDVKTGIIGERQIGSFGAFTSKQGLIHVFRPPTYPTTSTTTEPKLIKMH